MKIENKLSPNEKPGNTIEVINEDLRNKKINGG